MNEASDVLRDKRIFFRSGHRPYTTVMETWYEMPDSGQENKTKNERIRNENAYMGLARENIVKNDGV